MTGGGAIVRAAAHADDVVDAHKVANKAAATVKTTKQTTKQTPTHAPCKNSFSADTLVATAEGDVPISAIEVGDLVLAYHEATGATGVYTVTDTIAPVDPLVVVLTLATDDLETTLDHPFFTRTPGWVAARTRTPGAEVRRLDGGYGTVTRVVLAVRVQPMYNLTVAIAHTFFVGDDGWLVHNCGGKNYRQRKKQAESAPAGMTNPQVHHDLPQKHRRWFESKGIDIDDPAYTRWVQGGNPHQRWTRAFNDEWDRFIATHKNATKEQIVAFMNELRNDPRFPAQ